MSEMHTFECPSCGVSNQPLGVVGEAEQYRCRSCGMVYYGPAGCDTGEPIGGADAESDEHLADDWGMTTPSDDEA
jgi:rubredoxin